MKEGKRSRRTRWKLLLSVVAIVLLSVAGGLFHLLTFFERAMVRYARLCDREQAKWYDQVEEVPAEKLTESLYGAVYTKGSTVPAKSSRSFAYNAIKGREAHALKCQGMLYIVLHKWIGDCAGVCVPVEDGAKKVVAPELDYFPITDSQWEYWGVNFEK